MCAKVLRQSGSVTIETASTSRHSDGEGPDQPRIAMALQINASIADPGDWGPVWSTLHSP
jgi:hypothetical protein